MPTIRIRAAAPEDSDRLVTLQLETIGTSYRPFLGDAAVDGFLSGGAVEAMVAETVDRCRVLELDGRIAGCAITEGDLLDLMMIEPASHRMGLGSQLLAHVEGELFGQYPEIRLESFAPNDQANAFYRKHGWSEVDRFPDRESGVDKLTFTKLRAGM